MSYISWRNTNHNEANYMRVANDGALETFPAFKESAFEPASTELIGPVVDAMMNDENASLIAFACVFAEYLHEQYGVVPADCEILVQGIAQLLLKQIKSTAKVSAEVFSECIGDLFREKEQKEEDSETYRE